MSGLQPHKDAVSEYLNTPFKGKTIGDSDEFKAANQQADTYYDDLVAKFGQNTGKKLVGLFDDHYKKSILNFVDTVNAFAGSDERQLALRVADVLTFYADAF
ncbi:MAG: hypothetical protein ACYC7D_07475 [Nitrososphaerales archaeon]